MLLWSTEIPDSFAAALASGRVAEVCDAEAATAEARFGRGLARMRAGREADARVDLEAAASELGDVCRLELGFLDLQQRRSVDNALAIANSVLKGSDSEPLLKARSLHLVGLAHGKLRDTPAAFNALLDANELYAKLENRWGSSQVADTLGTLEAARGRLDSSLHYYSLSLIDKTIIGDRYGMALTLGNIGRVHLRAGRFHNAAECFRRDLELAIQLGDRRGAARMHEDLGRAYLGLERYEQVVEELEASRMISRQYQFHDLEFFALKDLVFAYVAQNQLRQAEGALKSMEEVFREGGEPYFNYLRMMARGELLRGMQDRRAIEVLRGAVDGFQAADLPDLEIRTRLSLAQAQVEHKQTAEAERCLLAGIAIAHDRGFPCYLTALNEMMGELDLTEGLVEESGRRVTSGAGEINNQYVIRQRLGRGAFGEVFRVYDPRRGKELALKRLLLDNLYDTRQRDFVLASARNELELAARVRHPGVVRVLAVGSEPHGGMYVIQEFIPGSTLRELFPRDNRSDCKMVLSYIERIANSLAALHDAGIVHRDLKSENIILREDGSPVLVDFGIAHVAQSKVRNRRIVGTLSYMAPEQAAGKQVDYRADVYSLGVLAYEWLTGILPLRPRGENLEQLLAHLNKQLPDPIADFRPGLPDPLQGLIMSMLAKSPKARPASAAEVARQCAAMAENFEV